ncbi:sensor histidine kinase [Psychrobacillus sp. NPDC093180]|uniref:sensor histidine kinase n=1 Tax=Psychrobacillus sp. NPDC093180 TaxID=3364489 RepID=UPI0037FC5795
MKLGDWLTILKLSRVWILLLFINCAFFIFLAWVVYPEAFKLLVGMMIVFSITSVMIGMLFSWRGKAKQDKVYDRFLKNPSPEQEFALIQSFGEIHKDKVHDLAKKLRMLNDRLDEVKLQSKDYEEFIESWVHEIKTPISLVNFVLQNRKDEMSELVYQRLEHARITIHDHVEQILYYARLQAIHIDYKLERVSLNQCLEDVLLEIQSLLDEKEVKVISQIKEVPVISDEKALQFIFTQIIVNAVKYSNEKVARFILLETGFDSVKNRYFLRITDNGIGVLSSDLPFIFDKGFTGDNPNRKQSTGIGLYLVKKLCDELQIEIEVESKYGKEFVIQFLFTKIEERCF